MPHCHCGGRPFEPGTHRIEDIAASYNGEYTRFWSSEWEFDSLGRNYMEVVAQLAERQIVALNVARSIRVNLPKYGSIGSMVSLRDL